MARPVHRVLRSYTSLHLLAVYVAYVGGLPGFGEGLQPGSAEPALRAVGLWHPRVALGMLPLLGLLLLVSLSAAVAFPAHHTHCAMKRQAGCQLHSFGLGRMTVLLYRGRGLVYTGGCTCGNAVNRPSQWPAQQFVSYCRLHCMHT